MLFEDSFIYFPSKYPDGNWQPPVGAAFPRVEDCTFIASDGVKLHGWHCTPPGRLEATAEGRPVLLWFHGNAGNLTHRYDTIVNLVRLPADVFILDYRGYGRSDAEPSEKGLYLDGRAAWDFLTDQRGVDPNRIVLFGRSLGGAVAIELATRQDVTPAGVIIESAFTSVPDMAAQIMPLIPRVLIRTQMRSIERIASIQVPKLFVHSVDDEIIPFDHGRRLFEAAAEPKQFYRLEGAGHNETDLVGGQAYLDALAQFIVSLVGS